MREEESKRAGSSLQSLEMVEQAAHHQSVPQSFVTRTPLRSIPRTSCSTPSLQKSIERLKTIPFHMGDDCEGAIQETQGRDYEGDEIGVEPESGDEEEGRSDGRECLDGAGEANSNLNPTK